MEQSGECVEWVEKSVEAKLLKEDFKIYDKTVEVIEQLDRGDDKDWNKFTDKKDIKLYYK